MRWSARLVQGEVRSGKGCPGRFTPPPPPARSGAPGAWCCASPHVIFTAVRSRGATTAQAQASRRRSVARSLSSRLLAGGSRRIDDRGTHGRQRSLWLAGMSTRLARVDMPPGRGEPAASRGGQDSGGSAMMALRGRLLWLLSWNVNGLRAALRKAASLPAPAGRGHPLPAGNPGRRGAGAAGPAGPCFRAPHQCFNPRTGPLLRDGGVQRAQAPRRAPRHGTPRARPRGTPAHLEFERFFLVNVYVPNASGACCGWNTGCAGITTAAVPQAPGPPQARVFCGDLNVAHRRSTWRTPSPTTRTPASRTRSARLRRILRAGFWTASGAALRWRALHLVEHATRARERNVGWRIDYFCCPQAGPALKEASSCRGAGLGPLPVGIRLEM